MSSFFQGFKSYALVFWQQPGGPRPGVVKSFRYNLFRNACREGFAALPFILVKVLAAGALVWQHF
jgi:hypothetical protein